MNRVEREALIGLSRKQARLAKAEAVQREKVLRAEVEDLLAAEFQAQDELWAEAVAIANEAATKANELIVARCADLGISAKHAPMLGLRWQNRSDSFIDGERRGELRKLAQAKLAALTETAKTMIDGKQLETETALIAGSLETEEAAAFLAAMPTAQDLMPSLGLDDLGVKHWQPPEGAASELLTPSTPADRRRRKVLRAIAAHPEASDRKIAELAGVDHKTVAAYRSRGELPAGNGEFPTDSEETE
jgi:hypothetical protein